MQRKTRTLSCTLQAPTTLRIPDGRAAIGHASLTVTCPGMATPSDAVGHSRTRRQSVKDIVQEAFERYDVDSSGTIDNSELRAALNHLGIPTDSVQATNVLKRFDADRSGALELSEFRRLHAELQGSIDMRVRQMEAEQWTAAKWLDATGVTSLSQSPDRGARSGAGRRCARRVASRKGTFGT